MTRLSRRAFVGAALLSPIARALGRKPYGGVVRLELPFAMRPLDPHAADDPLSALFGGAIADPLFAWDASGTVYPALAASMPEAIPGGARISLRQDLITTRGRALDARDVIASLERSRRGAGRPLLAPFGVPRRDPVNALSVVFPTANPALLADALASPATAILSRSSAPDALDGTGAFRATASGSLLVLERNERAARGPAFVNRVEIRPAVDLAASLRDFESGDADVGFLGAGLHRPRPGSMDLHTSTAGFVLLCSGSEAGAWGAPGITARLVDAMDPRALSHLGLVTSHGGGGGDPAWGGPPADLLVDEQTPYFAEVARAVAGILSRRGHELRPLPLPEGDLRKRRATGRYSLAIDFARKLGPTPRHALLSLLTAANPRLADKPPHLSGPDPVAVTRTLPVAILGELSLSGAHAPEVHGLDSGDLGNVFRVPP